MKYRITRTSSWWVRTEPPCKHAYEEGGIDKYGEMIWFVDIESLEDLHNLINEVGHAIILDDTSIEIYDDFRE